jgi:lysozyme
MKMSEEGLDKLEDYEGIRFVAYLDTGGVWTIGVGHTGPEVVKGLRASAEQIREWLRVDVEEAEEIVERLVKVPLNQNQFDALVSFVFNIGEGQFASSTLLKKLNAGDYEGAAGQFKRWVFDNGKQQPGLVKRRSSEEATFLA